jgi:hypothetical protein
MDRRQLLLGATALGLATNFNLNRLLAAQVVNTTTGDVRLSDRERAGLRGSIKTCSDFIDTDHRAVYRINLEGSGGIPMEVQDG